MGMYAAPFPAPPFLREPGLACRDADPELFFPDDYNTGDAEAKRICRHCPLRAKCAQFAVDNRVAYGVWGGLNPYQRTRIIHGLDSAGKAQG